MKKRRHLRDNLNIRNKRLLHFVINVIETLSDLVNISMVVLRVKLIMIASTNLELDLPL